MRELREAKDWSIDELANRAKTSRSYIHYLETNQRKKLYAPELHQVAEALGTTIDYLLTGKQTLIDLEKLDPQLQLIYSDLMGNSNVFFRKSGEVDSEGLKAIHKFIKFIIKDSEERDKNKTND